jgi:hypothetical protein
VTADAERIAIIRTLAGDGRYDMQPAVRVAMHDLLDALDAAARREAALAAELQRLRRVFQRLEMDTSNDPMRLTHLSAEFCKLQAEDIQSVLLAAAGPSPADDGPQRAAL